MTVCQAIKLMSKDELKTFIYWVYLNGVRDGENQVCDSVNGFFGGHILDKSVNELMPNGVESLWDKEEMRNVRL